MYTDSWTEVGSFGIGTFDYLLESLESGTIYYFRAKAHNTGGWSYGSESQFTTEKENLGVTGANQRTHMNEDEGAFRLTASIPLVMMGTLIFIILKVMASGEINAFTLLIVAILIYVFYAFFPGIQELITSLLGGS